MRTLAAAAVLLAAMPLPGGEPAAAYQLTGDAGRSSRMVADGWPLFQRNHGFVSRYCDCFPSRYESFTIGLGKALEMKHRRIVHDSSLTPEEGERL